MVDAVRAALRLLPAVRPAIAAIGGGAAACSRASRAAAGAHSASEQSALLALKAHPQLALHREPTASGSPALVRLARTVLAYVGAGLSAVTANQLSGPCVCQAKERGIGGPTEPRGMWQRTSASGHNAHEDAIRSPKYVHCPLPQIVSKSQPDGCHCWNSGWGPVDSQWQVGPNSNREYRSKLGGPDEGLNSRFSKPAGLQGLAADLESECSMKSYAGLMGTVSDYSSAADLELEWQLVVDAKPKGKHATPAGDGKVWKEDDGDAIFEEVDAELVEPEKKQLGQSSDVGTSKIMTKSGTEIGDSDYRVGKISGEAIMTNIEQHGSQRPSGGLDTSVKSPQKRSLLWGTAETMPLTEADLHSGAMSLSSFDISASKVKKGSSHQSLDKSLIAAILHENEPIQLENTGFSSPAVLLKSSDSTAAEPARFQKVSEPLAIPSGEVRSSTRHHAYTHSADSRDASWTGGGTMSTTASWGSGLLGEALCRSQTRAREAEKKVQQTGEEKERLVRLFFREASRSFTYRQWATSLQAENLWLKKFAPDESLAWLHRSFMDPFVTMERVTSSRGWKGFSENYTRQMEHKVSDLHQKDAVDPRKSNEIVMGCTLGIAFALGLSLAGAGLMLGWSMGWILLAYSVSV